MVIGLNKIGLTQDAALPFIGELHHIDVGVPISKLSKVDKKIFKVTYKDLKNIDLPSLPRNSNKYKRAFFERFFSEGMVSIPDKKNINK